MTQEGTSQGVSRRGFVAGGAAAVAGASLLGPGAGLLEARKRKRTRRGHHHPPPSHGRPPAPPPLVLTGGNVLDPLTGRETENAVVVLADRKVQLVASAKHVRGKRIGGGQVIDVAGAWLVPGLLDAHTHASSRAAAARALRAGATTIRVAASSFYADVGLRALADWLPAEVPTVQPGGLFVRPFVGDEALSDPRLAPLAASPGAPQTPEELRLLVSVNLDRGADHIKTWATGRAGVCEQDPQQTTYNVQQLRAIVEAARGRPVMCHSHGAVGCQNAVEAGVTSIEHGTYVTDETLELMRRRGTYFVPTISAMVDVAEPGGEYDEPCLQERGRMLLPILREAVRRAAAIGVQIVAGADTSYSDRSVTSVATEVQYLHEAGLSELDALRAATTTAARLMRVQRNAGRIARGFDADVLAVAANPLDDIATLQSPKLVIHGGAIARNELAN